MKVVKNYSCVKRKKTFFWPSIFLWAQCPKFANFSFFAFDFWLRRWRHCCCFLNVCKYSGSLIVLNETLLWLPSNVFIPCFATWSFWALLLLPLKYGFLLTSLTQQYFEWLTKKLKHAHHRSLIQTLIEINWKIMYMRIISIKVFLITEYRIKYTHLIATCTKFPVIVLYIFPEMFGVVYKKFAI